MLVDYKSIFRLEISFSVLKQWTSEVIDRLKIDRNWGFSDPPNFNGGSAPKFRTNFIKLHLYPTFWAKKVPCR